MKNTQLNHDLHSVSLKKYPLCFLAHNVDIALNVGSLFRVADALGVEIIYLSGLSPTPPDKKIRKTSRATEKYVEFSYQSDPFVLLQQLKSDGYTIISLEVTSSSIGIKELAVSKDEKICLILGSENQGVAQALLDLSDKTVHIPMLGHGSSMNVVVAGAIAAFEITQKMCF